MASTTLTRSAAVGVAAGLGAASLAGATTAMAAGECAAYTGATLLPGDVCQVVITEDGTVTLPASLGKVAALVIGAGGGGSYSSNYATAYGGGGGEVVYVDEVALGTPITATIGAAGAADEDGGLPAGDGGDTVFGSVTALGGEGADATEGTPGNSGNGNSWDIDASGWVLLGGGGGAQAAAVDAWGGMGYWPSEVPGASSALFPPAADDNYYGSGGNTSDDGVPPQPIGAGTGGAAAAFAQPVLLDIDGPAEGDGEVEEAEIRPLAEGDDEGANAGADGAVVLRWKAGLVPTGSAEPGIAIAFGAAAAAVGAGLTALVGSLRRRRDAS